MRRITRAGSSPWRSRSPRPPARRAAPRGGNFDRSGDENRALRRRKLRASATKIVRLGDENCAPRRCSGDENQPLRRRKSPRRCRAVARATAPNLTGGSRETLPPRAGIWRRTGRSRAGSRPRTGRSRAGSGRSPSAIRRSRRPSAGGPGAHRKIDRHQGGRDAHLGGADIGRARRRGRAKVRAKAHCSPPWRAPPWR